jgi:hypothetical protein
MELMRADAGGFIEAPVGDQAVEERGAAFGLVIEKIAAEVTGPACVEFEHEVKFQAPSSPD